MAEFIAQNMAPIMFASLVVFLLLGITFVVFCMMYLAPGDVTMMLVPNVPSHEQIGALRTEFGLDQPLPVRYARFIGQLARGDPGTSWIDRRPVLPAPQPPGQRRSGDGLAFELPYLITPIAAGPVTLMVIPANRLDHLVRRNPALAVAMIRDLANRMLAAEDRAREAEARALAAEERARKAFERVRGRWESPNPLRVLPLPRGSASAGG